MNYMTEMTSKIIATVFFCIQAVTSYPTGAPYDACSNLLPIHGEHQPQTSPAPYVLTASSTTYSLNKPITVILKGSGDTFKGFVIQAQDLHTGEPITKGEWRSQFAKQLSCAAATHINPSIKSKVELTWIPRDDKAQSGEVNFVATVVKDLETFYSGISTSPRSSSSGSANNIDQREQKRATPTQNNNEPSAEYVADPYESYGAVAQQREDVPNQYDPNYYATYDANSGYSGQQQDYAVSTSSADNGQSTNQQSQLASQQQDQSAYYANPSYQYQISPYQPPYPEAQPQAQVQVQSDSSYGNYPAPTYQAQRYSQPNYRFPFQQPFRPPWNHPRF